MEHKFIPCIGFSGYAGAGKNTAAEQAFSLLEKAGHKVSCMAFAQPIKEMIRGLMRYTYPSRDIDMEYMDALKNDVMINPIPGVRANMRKLLQTLGTEWGRQCIDDDLWVKVAVMRMDEDPMRVYLFTDVRFANEADMIRKKGGFVIHIEREGAGTQAHLSEKRFPPSPSDFVISNNGSVEALASEIKTILRKKELI